MTTVPPARSLAEALRAWTDEQFVELLRARPDLLTPVPHDMASLAARASSIPSVSRALDQLDQFSLDVLEAAAVLHEQVNVETLSTALPGVDRAALEDALVQLRSLALLYGPEGEERLVRGAVDALGPTVSGLGPAMAASHADVSALASDPARLRELLAEGPEGASAALDQLLWGPPHGRIENARRLVKDPAQAKTPVEWLLAHSFLVAVGPDTVVLPREVALVLRDGVVRRDASPRPPILTGEPREHVEASAAGQAFSAVRLVETLLEAWGLDSPAVLRAGGLGVRELKRTAGLLDVDEITAAAVIEVARAAGLLAADGELNEAFAPTPGYDLWLAQETADRWSQLAAAWLAAPRAAGLVGSRDTRDKTRAALGPDLERPAAPDLRAAVLTLLADLPEGHAPSPEQLMEQLDWSHPRRGGPARHDLITWTLAEAELLGITGRGALSRPGRALLTEGSDEAADMLAPLLPTPLDHVLIQADLTAVAPGPLESALAGELALVADVESTGGATVFRFTPDSVRRALDAGRSAADLHAMLAARSKTAVPQPLTYLIDDVARRHGRIRVGVASAYIRCDDLALLDEMLADRRSATLRMRRLAPTVVAAQAPVDQVLAGLRSMGLAPAAEAPDGSVVVRRPDSRRTPPRQRPPRLAVRQAMPGEKLLTAAVRAIRAGERASTAPRGRTVGSPFGGAVPRSSTAETLSLLGSAVQAERPLWIGYVDPHGGVTERVVDPLRLAGGYLTAFDHRKQEVHTFAVHRISGVAELTDGETVGGSGDNGQPESSPEGVA